MKILFSLRTAPPYLEFPAGLIGWFGWFSLAALVIFLIWRWRRYNRPFHKRQIVILVLLGLLALPGSLLFGVRLPDAGALTPPELPVDPLGPAAMVFSALPWTLAAGLLGPAAAAGLAFLTGLVQALFDTHHLFTPLEMALLAVLFGVAVNQRYRTLLYKILRQPVIAAALTTFLYIFIYVTTVLFTSRGVLVTRLDYALTHLENVVLALAIELGVAGVFAQVFSMVLPNLWQRRGELEPSPSEKSLGARFLYSLAPGALVLLLVLIMGDWMIATRAAREMLRDRMGNAAQMAAEGVPYFLETGQNLVTQLAASPRLRDNPSEDLNTVLSDQLRTVPFFRQLYLLDAHGNPIAGYPLQNYASALAPAEEQMGVQLALSGVPVQSYSAPPTDNETAAEISFMATVSDGSGNIQGVLIGRSDLASNPLTEPILNSLNNLAGEDGQGMLIDENNRILYHPNKQEIMTSYTGRTTDETAFYDDTGPDGTRRLVYFQKASGRPWAVALVVPAHRSQQLALEFAAPLLGVILVLSILAVFSLRFGLRMVTASLQNLSLEAGRISQGQLDHALPVSGEDEVGLLRRAFEGMRVSLKARLDELNRLLLVSQGVASSLEIQEAVKPVLESALATGGCSARVVLSQDVIPDLDDNCASPLSYGIGPAKELYAYLDDQVLAITRQQERLALTNLNRPRLLSFAPDSPRPESILAIALRHENMYYGALWVAYDQTHSFDEEEVRFLVTIASQAALAAANTRLFLNAETGRQRLAAILASNPDPVLVTDQHDRLLLANPAAWQVLSLGMESDEGQPIERVISQKEILGLLRSPASEKGSVEVALPGGRIFLATATPVLTEGRRVGRVCVLRDVTHFKELDALKSEFVNTVSHDLRSPLTLMRGYATMLEMVGQLNEQQVSYVRKILGSVESMTRLVNHLLDLGRIEAGVGLQIEMIPAQEIVERVINDLQLLATQKKVSLSMEFPQGNLPLVEADQSLLQQAIQNLVDNAIKYTRPEGKVTVRVQTRQENMIFEVIDTGVGISPMDQPRLFERFYRGVQPGSKEERGAGLGLAIVKSIAERHGGKVWIESQLGKGSTFYLSIPMRQPSQR